MATKRAPIWISGTVHKQSEKPTWMSEAERKNFIASGFESNGDKSVQIARALLRVFHGLIGYGKDTLVTRRYTGNELDIVHAYQYAEVEQRSMNKALDESKHEWCDVTAIDEIQKMPIARIGQWIHVIPGFYESLIACIQMKDGSYMFIETAGVYHRIEYLKKVLTNVDNMFGMGAVSQVRDADHPIMLQTI